jgi:hypothetical protein
MSDAWYGIQQYDNYRNEYWGWQNGPRAGVARGEPNYANYFRELFLLRIGAQT